MTKWVSIKEVLETHMLVDCSEIIDENKENLHNGVSVLDFNQDGKFEIFVCGFGSANKVFAWDGVKLKLLDIPAIIKDTAGEAISVCAADIDADGQEEFYVLNNDTEEGDKAVGDRLFAKFGDHWMDLFASAENAHMMNFGSGRSLACLDRMGLGKYGFIVANRGNPWRLYELNEKGKVFDVAEEAGLDVVAEGMSILSAQIISEHMDVFATTRQANLLFKNLGSGIFEEVAKNRGVDDPGQVSSGVTVIDSDGDGLLDIIYGSRNGKNRLYLQCSGGGFAEAEAPNLENLTSVQNIIVADFDNDGYEEIFFHINGGKNRLFKRREDEWVETNCLDAADEDGEARGAVIGDFDEDGQLELLLTRGFKTPQKLKLFKALPTQNNWLRICPLTPSGAPARGAVIKIYAENRSQMRSLCAGSGYLCQMEPVAHFGLGEATSVEQIEIKWPDGGFEVLKNIKPNQTLTILHPEGRHETIAEKC